MPKHWRILLIVALPFFLVLLWALSDHQSGYHHFISMDSAYYRQFATACDSLLQRRAADPTAAGGTASEDIDIPKSDPTLPKIISDIGPETMRIRPDRVFIGILRGGAFAVFWTKSDTGTNVWHLRAGNGSELKTLYEASKP